MRPTAIHLCVLGRNAGDNALNLSIRQGFGSRLIFRHMELLRNKWTPVELAQLHSNNLIVFGGGGMIHAFTPQGASKKTGTMWHIEWDDLDKLETPIVLYAVGYNHFHGEAGPTLEMKRFFEVLVRKKALISFRNDGTEAELLKAFPFLEGHVETIPDPGIFFRPLVPRNGSVVLQIASDRLHYRYPKGIDDFLDFVAKLRKRIQREIILLPHTIDDKRLYDKLTLPEGVRLAPLKVEAESTNWVIGHYSAAEFVIATRGHSQICSIGNSTPVFSIATHPKVVGFARECGMADWTYDYMTQSHEEGFEIFDRFLTQLDPIRTHLQSLNLEFDARRDAFNEKVMELALRNKRSKLGVMGRIRSGLARFVRR